MSITDPVTVLLSTGEVCAASLLTFCTAQLSAVVGVPKVTLTSARLQAPASLARLSAPGARSEERRVGKEGTTCVAVALLPRMWLTVQVTVVLPTGKELGASLLT